MGSPQGVPLRCALGSFLLVLGTGRGARSCLGCEHDLESFILGVRGIVSAPPPPSLGLWKKHVRGGWGGGGQRAPRKPGEGVGEKGLCQPTCRKLAFFLFRTQQKQKALNFQ